mmetsp:Transcript_13252/g.38565  ORF Transcript_13252/g.38565 Transcript_13252/m.38565 type:complete len:299 (-) Transcript_13252:167-1063(-)
MAARGSAARGIVGDDGFQSEALAGAFAGAVGTVLGYPLDVIKTRMQTGSAGMLRSVRDVYGSSGVTGFYRGIGAPLLSLIILNVTSFANYARFCKELGVDLERRTVEWRVVAAGVATGVFASLISTPFELLKIQMQLQSSRAQGGNHGPLRTSLDIVRVQGPLGLYFGHNVNCVREMVFLGAYFGLYEHTKSLFNEALPFSLGIPLAGGLAGGAGWVISFPLDLVKSRVQSLDLSKRVDPRAIDQASEIGARLFRTHGMAGLYRGVGPSLLRAFLVSGSRFSAYEFAMHIQRPSLIAP